MKKIFLLWLCGCGVALGQANQGELQVKVTDPAGTPVRGAVRIISESNHYTNVIVPDAEGRAVLQHLPFGLYRVEVRQPGFAGFSKTLEIQSSIPLRTGIEMKLSSVRQSIDVAAGETLLDTDLAGSVSQIGAEDIGDRLKFHSRPFDSGPGELTAGLAL